MNIKSHLRIYVSLNPVQLSDPLKQPHEEASFEKLLVWIYALKSSQKITLLWDFQRPPATFSHLQKMLFKATAYIAFAVENIQMHSVPT